MLRRHNPGLASKVRLDPKGKLKVFRVDEASRDWIKKNRQRKRNRKGGVGGLQILRTQKQTAAVSGVIYSVLYPIVDSTSA